MPTRETSEQIDRRPEDLYRRHRPAGDERVARYYDATRGSYGPESAGDERDRFAICLARVDGNVYCVGDSELRFPLQSLSKVFVYGLALADRGRESVLKRVGVEPSGDAFNSIDFDERNHRPYNPRSTPGRSSRPTWCAAATPRRSSIASSPRFVSTPAIRTSR